MAVRFKGRCRFCPTPESTKTSPPKLKAKPDTSHAVLSITTPGEGQRLWKHVLFGTSTCVSMIEGYAALGMPGDPCCPLVELRDRLSKVISNIEANNVNTSSHASHNLHASADRPSSADSAG